MEEFARLFSPSRAYKLPLFRMDLTFDDEKMEFYPSFQDLEEAVMEILNKITNTMQVHKTGTKFKQELMETLLCIA